MYTDSTYLSQITGYSTPNNLKGGGLVTLISKELILKADYTAYSGITTLQKGGLYLFDVLGSAKLTIDHNTI